MNLTDYQNGTVDGYIISLKGRNRISTETERLIVQALKDGRALGYEEGYEECAQGKDNELT